MKIKKLFDEASHWISLSIASIIMATSLVFILGQYIFKSYNNWGIALVDVIFFYFASYFLPLILNNMDRKHDPILKQKYEYFSFKLNDYNGLVIFLIIFFFTIAPFFINPFIIFLIILPLPIILTVIRIVMKRKYVKQEKAFPAY